ncbi:MAG: glutathione S-transferase N-terminal domain-containing protein [Gammaproteobacteria bacterium]
MPTLYHFWSVPEAQRIRLALGYKGMPWEDCPLEYQDDATFFDLGVERRVPILRLDDGRLLRDSQEILERIDELLPTGAPLVGGQIAAAAWSALLAWRTKVDAVLQRLYAPARPAYRDVGTEPDSLTAYKAEIEGRYGLSVEALANDRYAGYAQFERITRLGALTRHLVEQRFYTGRISVADLLLTADLFPLQLLDGISLPVDLMYYFSRVEEACRLDLREGLLLAG